MEQERKLAPKMPDLLTRSELASYLKVTPRTLHNYEERGLLHPVAMGRKKYYRQDEIINGLTQIK